MTGCHANDFRDDVPTNMSSTREWHHLLNRYRFLGSWGKLALAGLQSVPIWVVLAHIFHSENAHAVLDLSFTSKVYQDEVAHDKRSDLASGISAL